MRKSIIKHDSQLEKNPQLLWVKPGSRYMELSARVALGKPGRKKIAMWMHGKRDAGLLVDVDVENAGAFCGENVHML